MKLIGTVVFAGCCLCGAVPAGAQQPQPQAGENWWCGDYEACGGTYDHKIIYHLLGWNITRSTHSECLVCVSGGEYVDFHYCHSSCVEPAPDYDLAVAAMKDHEFGALMSLVKTAPAFVSINHERASIQLTSCNGALVGNLPLPTRWMALAEQF